MVALTLLKAEALPLVLGDMQVKVDAAEAAAGQAAGAAGQTAQDRAATAAAALATEEARQQAVSLATVAATAAAFRASLAEGRAAVADGATFGVLPGGVDALPRATLYRRDSAAAQTAVGALLVDDDVAERDYRAGIGRYALAVPEGYMPKDVDATGRALSLVITPAQRDQEAEGRWRAAVGFYRVPLSVSPDRAPLVLTPTGRVITSVVATARSLSEAVWRIWTNGGQSNGEGQAGSGVALVYPYTQRNLMTWQRGSSADQWLGLVTTGGDSLTLEGSTITGIGPLVPQIAPSGSHGTTSAEAMARRALGMGAPPILTWSNAEGGQDIADLLPGAALPAHGFANIVTALTRAQALKPAGVRLVYDWTIWQQGESDTGNAGLGALHDQYRGALQAQARTILGQTEALRMISLQPSSFGTSAAARSILQYALDYRDDGLFLCGGPTYGYPWSSDYLHQTSLGHAMAGEAAAAIIARFEVEGRYLPLYAVAATVTGANQITLTMSEEVEAATDSVVTAIANLGLTLTGGTIAAVQVTGRQILITTTGAASSVTAVNIGLTGHGDTRAAETIPRTNIRAVRPLGALSAGGRISAWACHQSINIGA